MRFKLNKHLFIVVNIQGIQKNCIICGESVRDSALLTAEDLTFSRPAGYCFDWQVLIYNQRTPVPEPDLFYRCLTSLPKVIVFFKNEILIKICLKNMRSKWFSFGSNCLWMYGASPVRDRLSFATHWTILVFFHNLFLQLSASG